MWRRDRGQFPFKDEDWKVEEEEDMVTRLGKFLVVPRSCNNEGKGEVEVRTWEMGVNT